MRVGAIVLALSLAYGGLAWAIVRSPVPRARTEPAMRSALAGKSGIAGPRKAEPSPVHTPTIEMVVARRIDVSTLDAIELTELLGTRRSFHAGDTYVLTGRYVFHSATRGALRVRSAEDEFEKPAVPSESEALGRIDAADSGAFEFRFQPKREIWGVDVEFVSAANGARLGGIRLTNLDC